MLLQLLRLLYTSKKEDIINNSVVVKYILSVETSALLFD